MILVEDGPNGAPALFDRPRRLIRADGADEVASALAALDTARDEGMWIAGFASYELGYALEPRLKPLMPDNRRLPLLAFGLYDAPEDAAGFLERAAEGASGARLSAPEPCWSAEDHGRALGRIHDYIAAGDIYQANLTMGMRARRSGSAPGPLRSIARPPTGAPRRPMWRCQICRSCCHARRSCFLRPMQGEGSKPGR